MTAFFFEKPVSESSAALSEDTTAGETKVPSMSVTLSHPYTAFCQNVYRQQTSPKVRRIAPALSQVIS